MKETKELLKFVIELGEAVEGAMADKKFELAELSLLIGPLMQAGPAFEGFENIGAEIKAMDAAKMADLVAYIEVELDLASDKVEEIIEKGLATALVVYNFVQLFKKEVVVAEDVVV